jgi:hypothetical protein
VQLYIFTAVPFSPELGNRLPNNSPIDTVVGMPLDKPLSKALVDLQWARVYADRIEEELKLVANSLTALNGHVMNPQFVKGALVLRGQMKQASKQVGAMREISRQIENRWKNTIKHALSLKHPAAKPRPRRAKAKPASA